MKIGFFGGSFDPLHLGHVIPLFQAREFLGLDRIILIPSYQKIFRIDDTLEGNYGASPSDRLNMLDLFCRDYSFMDYDDFEIRGQRKVYTIETLRYLLDRYQNDEPILIIGRDNFDRFHEWKDYHQILELIPIGVMDRPEPANPPGPDFQAEPINSSSFRMILNPPIGISSTMVRQWCRSGRPIEWLVPASVLNYIRQHHLYGV